HHAFSRALPFQAEAGPAAKRSPSSAPPAPQPGSALDASATGAGGPAAGARWEREKRTPRRAITKRLGSTASSRVLLTPSPAAPPPEPWRPPGNRPSIGFPPHRRWVRPSGSWSVTPGSIPRARYTVAATSAGLTGFSAGYAPRASDRP